MLQYENQEASWDRKTNQIRLDYLWQINTFHMFEYK